MPDEKNYLNASDEEILNMPEPERVETPAPEPVVEEPVVTEPPVVEEPVVGELSTETEEEANPLNESDEVKETTPKEVISSGSAKSEVTPTKKETEVPKTEEPAPIDYRAAYETIMGPIKANGKELQLQSPEEAVKLIQMGANYTKKMQALQPSLRVLKMLENNKLLDEAKLSYLIDLDQRKPEAIQKLLADSKFDPLEIDSEKAAKYVPGNHRVSDNEVRFNQVLDDVEQTDTGPELIQEVAKQWDADSKQALYQDPDLLQVINSQKANGIYGRITNELHRRQALGELQGVPFIYAYKTVGDELFSAGKLAPVNNTPTRPEPVATRVAAPAPKVIASAQAKAASSPKSGPTSAPANDFNPLAQSDDEFLKQMEGRL